MRVLLWTGVGVLCAAAALFGLHFYLRGSGPPPAALFSDDALTRLLAVANLRTKSPQAFEALLVMAFEDGVELLRAEATERLAYLWGKDAYAALRRLIRDPSPLVRCAVIAGLSARKEPPPKWLKDALKDEKDPLARGLYAFWERRLATP